MNIVSHKILNQGSVIELQEEYGAKLYFFPTLNEFSHGDGSEIDNLYHISELKKYIRSVMIREAYGR